MVSQEKLVVNGTSPIPYKPFHLWTPHLISGLGFIPQLAKMDPTIKELMCQELCLYEGGVPSDESARHDVIVGRII